MQVIEDGCVPVERVGEYVAAVRRAADETEHPGGAVRPRRRRQRARECAPRRRRARGWKQRLGRLYDRVADVVIGLGGVPSGEHGAGRLRAGLLERVYGAEIVQRFREVKQCFDPLGILNPGVILPSGEPPLSRLKVGAGAARLPRDVERGLREIEQTAGYATPRLRLADR